MKRKRLLAVMLSAVMLITAFTSCSGKETEEKVQTEDGEIEKTQILTHVFKGEDIVLPDGYQLNPDVEVMHTAEGRLRVYCHSYEQTEKKTVTRRHICEMNEDGTDPVITDVHLSENADIDMGMMTEDYFVFLTRPNITSYHLYIYSFAEESTVKVGNVGQFFPEDEISMLTGIQADADGYVYVSSELSVCVFAPDGTRIFDYIASGKIQSLRQDADGVIYTVGQIDGGLGLQAVDRENKRAGAAYPLPADISADDFLFAPGYALYYSNTDGLYGYNAGMETGEQVISWANSDLNPETFDRIKVLSPEAVILSYSDKSGTARKAVHCVLRKSPDIDLSGMQVVELAYVDMEYGISDLIIRFNRNSDTVRVVLKDYSVYNTRENNDTGGETRLMNDILNGLYQPDIVCGESDGTIISAMIERGLFTDLYPYIDRDDRIDREDIVGCVKNVYDVDGQLSAICRYFQVTTLLAKEETVGKRDKWTLGDMLDLALSLEDGQVLMEELTRENAAEKLLGPNSYAEFIDMENHTCHFDSPTFYKLLQYISTLPTAAEGGASYSGYEGTATGKVMLYEQYYWTADGIQSDIVPFNTPDTVKIGYPTSEDGRSDVKLSTYSTYLIPSFAQNPDAAWDFICEMLTGNAANDGMSGALGELGGLDRFALRVLKSQIHETAADGESRQVFYSFNGSTKSHVGSAEYKWVLDEKGRLNGEPGILVEYSREKVDEFLAWLDSVGTSVTNAVPEEISAIVDEEITAFTGGARSAEDTAKIIQSRVSIWLAEHS